MHIDFSLQIQKMKLSRLFSSLYITVNLCKLIFIGRTDAEAEAPRLGTLDVKS